MVSNQQQEPKHVDSTTSRLVTWSQRLPGRLIGSGSTDYQFLHTIAEELAGVTRAEQVAIWNRDASGAAVRRVRWPADEMRTVLEDQIGQLLRSGETKRVLHLVRSDLHGGMSEVLVEPVGTDVPDAWLVLVRGDETPWIESEIKEIRTIATELNGYLVQPPGGPDRAIQDLVADTASELMSVGPEEQTTALTALMARLGHFFDVDVVFLRVNDHERRVTAMAAEWPVRVDVPDPDPLGVVPFDSDPQWAALEFLAEPFIIRPLFGSDDYKDRLDQASGVDAATTAMVPMRAGQITTGTLGCVKFGDRAWSHEEVSALRAIAALVVQFLARIAAEVSAEYQGSHDELTGLLRRAPFLAAISERVNAGKEFAVVAVELDRFDVISESLGVDASDSIVVTVADRLSQTLRTGDRIARVGPARFATVFDVEADASLQSLVVAARLLEFVRQPIEVGGSEIVRTASAGIVVVDAAGRGDGVATASAADLLQRASIALAEAKRHGGDRFEIFEAGATGVNTVTAERLTEEALLRRALGRHELAVHYQPEINLIDGSVLGAEALIRWHHPQKGLLTAGAFIDLAEESGLVVELGWWVLTEACRQAAQWVADGVVQRPFEIRINLAAAQLASDEVVDRVREALETHGLPPESVCLEITETSVMADFEVSKGVLGRLRELGVRLAVDDFGTGFSSMSYIRDLPVQIVKIDQTFVKGLGTKPADEVIVDSMIQLGMALGLDVVAEGLEELVHWKQLVAMGCNRAQGFYLARPASATDIEATLRTGIPELVPEVTS